MPASCQNCRNRVEIVKATSIWVDLTENHCREFVRSRFDRVTGETVTPLPCTEAMERFCGLSAWRPTLAYRIKSLID